MQPRDEEVRAFVDDLLLHTSQAIEDDSPGTAPDIVDRGVEEESGARCGASKAVEIVKGVGHGEGVGGGMQATAEEQLGRGMMSGFSQCPIGFSAPVPTSPDFVFSHPPFALPRLHLLRFVFR